MTRRLLQGCWVIYCRAGVQDGKDLWNCSWNTIKDAELVGKDIAHDTLTRYETTLMHVKNFIQTKYRQQEIALQSINHEFLKNFEHYLKTVRNCGHNTTVKYIRNLRKGIRIALSNDWLKLDPFRNITYRLKEVNRAYLTDPELKLLINSEFSNEHKSKQRILYKRC